MPWRPKRRCFMSAAKNRPIRSGCVPNAWARYAQSCNWPPAPRPMILPPPSPAASINLVIVDSIQTSAAAPLLQPPARFRRSPTAPSCSRWPPSRVNTAVILVGHVTKEGSIAGPKVLEHVVDVVLQLEGDRYGGFKMLRAIKNRFGSTNEAGIFEMVDDGLAAGRQSLGGLAGRASDQRRLGRAGDDGRHPAVAGRSPGAGQSRPATAIPSEPPAALT